MKILVIDGPNINLLGLREPEIYGRESYQDLLALLEETGRQTQVQIDHYQSNHEGCLVDAIQRAYGCYDALVINPAAYTHTSIAILDALMAVGLPAVEVHISAVSRREHFRQISYAGMACRKRIEGQGIDGYRQAIEYLIRQLSSQ